MSVRLLRISASIALFATFGFIVAPHSAFSVGRAPGPSLEASAWTQWSPNPPLPSARREQGGAYDSANDRLVIFGGDPTHLGDTWVLPAGGDWSQLVTPVHPDGRRAPGTMYDPLRQRMILFGGLANYPFADAWALDLAGTPAWTQLFPSGPAPAARSHFTTVYDSRRDRMVVFGGYPTFSDVWALDFSPSLSWSRLDTGGMSWRWGHVAVYDSVADRMVVFGGSGTTQNDVRAFDFSSNQWSTVAVDPGLLPPVLIGAAAITDRGSNSMIVHGGVVGGVTIGANSNDLWALSLSGAPAWRLLSDGTAGPRARRFQTAGLRTATNEMVVFGGYDDPGLTFLNDTWAFALNAPVAAPPRIDAAVPDSGRFRDHVRIVGEYFTGVIRVDFGTDVTTEFVVVSDTEIDAVIGHDATTGPIRVLTPDGTAISSFAFRVLPPEPAPRIAAVRDVPLDQGGKVSVAWDASDLDNDVDHVITGYRVWRRLPLAASLADRARAVAFEAGPDGYWESVAAEIPAAFLNGYGHVAATVSDSTAGGNPYTAFVVQALTAQWTVFYWSNVDSGYSVDNLAPAAPTAFVAVASTGGVALHWGAGGEADLAGYSIHRGDSPDFVPSGANQVATVPDTGYTDPQGTFGLYYKLCAVDVHGNTGGYALAFVDRPVEALASLALVSRTDDGIRLEWRVAAVALSSWRLDRLVAGAWERIGEAVVDAGALRFLDADSRAGARRYRLSDVAGGISLEFDVRIPEAELAVRGVWPNPILGGSASFRIAIAGDAPARIDVLDVSGRVVATRSITGLGAGEHPVEISGLPRLPAGVLFVRLSQGSRKAWAKVAVVR